MNGRQLESLRAAKAAERGGFADRIVWPGNVETVLAGDGQNIGAHDPDVPQAIPGEAADEDGLGLPGGVLAASISFHEAFDLPRQSSPNVKIGESLARLRIALLAEEVDEFVDAVAASDLVAIADALADIVYVAYGTAVTYGIDLDLVLGEVHRSNMSKLGKAGRRLIREDGKVIKSDQYFPPDIARVLELQRPLPLTTTGGPGT
jgi:predicted HAD superfamily Cof-like phosphohydrolase